MQIALLLDEMWSPRIADALRERGHDVVAVAERVDLRGKPDEVIFEAAQAEGRAIVTENVVGLPAARGGSIARWTRSSRTHLHE